MTHKSHFAKPRFPHPPRPAVPALFLALLLTAMLAAACSTTSGQVRRTSVGGSVGSTGTVGGISTGIGPKSALITYRDELFNGPSEARIRHKQALTALNEGDYETAASLFETTLESYPAHPDATYYLGLTRIYQNQREAGFELLKSYHDPAHFRITKWVRKMALFLEEKEDLTPKTVHQTLNRYRTDAYNQERNDNRDLNTWD